MQKLKKITSTLPIAPASLRAMILCLFTGAHMNAAVSLAMCTFGRLAWKMLPVYVFAQLLGSFLAAATIYTVFNGKDRCA